MEGITEIEFNGLCLSVEWLWEPADYEGHDEAFFAQEIYVLDDQGNKFAVDIPDEHIAKIEEMIQEIEDKNRDLDREP